MAVVKISELVVAGALTGAELMEAVQGGVNKKVTIQDIANFAGPSFYSTNGQLASDRTVDLNGKVLTFDDSGTPFFKIDPTLNNESVKIHPVNIASNNDAFAEFITTDVDATVLIKTDFNGSDKIANIQLFADATTATLAYTADTHTFTAGAITALSLQPRSLTGNASDGTGNSQIVLSSDGGDQYFDLSATDDQITLTQIRGDAVAETITLTAANGLVINGTPAVTDDVAIVGLTNTYTLHFICGLYTGTTIT